MDYCAQKIDINDFDNKAQAYAILSAQYSKDAYSFSKKNFFSSSLRAIKQNCDTAILYTQIAIEYADSAYESANDTSNYSKSIISNAKEHQQKAINRFKKIKLEGNSIIVYKLSEKTMYTLGNAIVDAYEASLFFERENEENENNLISNNDSDTKVNSREHTRLESDEFSYLTIKELYGKRLIEIEDERLLLEAELKKSKGKKRAEIDNVISQLKIEEKETFEKMKSSDDRLVSVRNELSEEMLKIVDKDIFTTGKEDFYNENIPVPMTSVMPEGLVYRVQIGFFKSQLPPKHFKGIFPISKEKIDKIYYRYVAGNFAKYEDAKNATKAIVKKGYSDSFVVAYINGKKVTMTEAIKEEKMTTN
jgi:hypothetical protein